MTLPSTGAISLSQVQGEFGGSNPISLSEYYGAASGVPSSGAISLSHFRGKSGSDTITLTNYVYDDWLGMFMATTVGGSVQGINFISHVVWESDYKDRLNFYSNLPAGTYRLEANGYSEDVVMSGSSKTMVVRTNNLVVKIPSNSITVTKIA